MMQFPLELQLYGVKAQQIFTYWKQFKRSTYTHLKGSRFLLTFEITVALEIIA
jgi:hypothetical protein